MRRRGTAARLAPAAVLTALLPFQAGFPGPAPGTWERLAGWLTLCSLALVVVHGSARLIRSLGLEGRADRLAAGVLLAALHAVLPTLVLGHFGLLTPTSIVASQALLGLLLAFIPVPEARPQQPEPARPMDALQRLSRAVLIVLGALAGASLLQGLLDPPATFDALVYHLTFPVYWLKAQSLDSPRLMFGGTSQSFFPIHTELFYAVLLAPLRGSDLAARFGELPFCLATLAALSSLARRLGLGSAGTSVLLLLGLSNSWVLADSAHRVGSDMSLAAAELGFVTWALLPRSHRRARVLLCGLALGWVLGVKYIGVLHLPALAAFYALCAALDAQAGRRLRRGLTELACVLLLGGAIGGYAYLRNALFAGSPFYPARVQLLGFSFGRGEDPFVLTERLWGSDGYGALDGLLRAPDRTGGHFPFVTLPLALLALPALARRERKAFQALCCLVLAGAFWGLVALLMSYYREPTRYFYAGVLLVPLGAAWLAERSRFGRAVQALAVAAAAVAAVRLGPEILGTRLQAGLFLAATLAAGWGLACSARLLRRLGLAGLVAGPLFLPFAEPRYLAERYLRWERETPQAGRGWRQMARWAPGGQIIVSVGRNRMYPLLGARLTNTVVQLPVNRSSAGAETFGWGTFDTRSRGRAGARSAERFHENVRRAGADFVFVEARPREGFPEELGWILAEPQRYVPLNRRSQGSRIFAVQRRAGTARPRLAPPDP